MPYITPERREAILAGAKPQDPGELNFAITTLVDSYLQDKGGIRYGHLNEVIGALDCAKLELYRRVAAPYEDKKNRERRRLPLQQETGQLSVIVGHDRAFARRLFDLRPLMIHLRSPTKCRRCEFLGGLQEYAFPFFSSPSA